MRIEVTVSRDQLDPARYCDDWPVVGERFCASLEASLSPLGRARVCLGMPRSVRVLCEAPDELWRAGEVYRRALRVIEREERDWAKGIK